MPAKPSHNAPPPGLVPPTAAGVESPNVELTAAGRELAEELGTSRPGEFSSPAERRAAERTARRRQRAEAHDAAPDRGSRSPQTRVRTPAGISVLRDSLPAPLVALIAGGVVGVILDALSVSGWVIGLLVAGLTVVLLQVLGSREHATRPGTQ